MKDTLAVTAVIINHRKPDYLDRATRSVRRFYPTIEALLIDNGSGDRTSGAVMMDWMSRHPEHTALLLNKHNLHHGPAIDRGLHHAATPLRGPRRRDGDAR